MTSTSDGLSFWHSQMISTSDGLSFFVSPSYYQTSILTWCYCLIVVLRKCILFYQLPAESFAQVLKHINNYMVVMEWKRMVSTFVVGKETKTIVYTLIVVKESKTDCIHPHCCQGIKFGQYHTTFFLNIKTILSCHMVLKDLI